MAWKLHLPSYSSFDMGTELNVCIEAGFFVYWEGNRGKVFKVQFVITRSFLLPSSALCSCKELMASTQSASLFWAQLPLSQGELLFYYIHYGKVKLVWLFICLSLSLYTIYIQIQGLEPLWYVFGPWWSSSVLLKEEDSCSKIKLLKILSFALGMAVDSFGLVIYGRNLPSCLL